MKLVEQFTLFDEGNNEVTNDTKSKGESQRITPFKFGDSVTIVSADAEKDSVETIYHLREHEGKTGEIIRRLPYAVLQYEVELDGGKIELFYHDEMYVN